MVRSILAAIEQIKSEVAHWLTADSILEVCHAVHHVWRDRVLDPVATVHLFILQVLHGNTACAHVPRLGALDCSAGAYCQARGRLPRSVLEGVLKNVATSLPVRGEQAQEGRWHGHRTFLLDGSSVSMPDTPDLQKEFGQPGAQKKGCGFPVMHLLAMFDAATGFLIRMVSSPLRTHDMSQIPHVHPDLSKGDVLVGDRGFSSFVHLALLKTRGILGLFRVHQKQIVSFRPHRLSSSQAKRRCKAKGRRGRIQGPKGRPTSRWVRRLGKHDQLVEYVKPKKAPDWLEEAEHAKLPDVLLVREVRYTIPERGRRTRCITLATTLIDAQKYSAADLAELYGQRWQIELNFRHLKQTLRMDVLRCKSVEGVRKELLVYALVYNLVRLVMLKAAQEQGVPVERISFVDAVRWLASALDQVPVLRLRTNPYRPGRWEPRAVKRRPKEYDRLNKPRKVLRKLLLAKRDKA